MTKNKKSKSRKSRLTLIQQALNAKPTLRSLDERADKIDGAIRQLAQQVDRIEQRASTDINALIGNYREHGARLIELEAAAGPTWKTADGTVLRMREMTDTHLKNAIALLERSKAKKVAEVNTTASQVAKAWLSKWELKLEQLYIEKARRERFAKVEQHYKDLHNGTGPYAGEASYEENGQRITLPPGRYTMRLDACTREVLDNTIAACKAKFNNAPMPVNTDADSLKAQLAHIRAALMPIFGSTHLDTLDLVKQLVTRRIKGTPALTVRHQAEKIQELQAALAAKTSDTDGQLAYWKKAAEKRLETLLALRQTIKVLQHEIRGLKGSQRRAEELGGDRLLARNLVRDLAKLAEHPLGRNWLPLSRAGRIEAGLKRLLAMLGS